MSCRILLQGLCSHTGQAKSLPLVTLRQFAIVASERRPRDASSIFGIEAKSGKMNTLKDSHSGRFHQRRLPQSQIPFASKKGRRLFREAVGAGDAENFYYLAEQFRTQDEPTFCGLSTLAMVLNSLTVDSRRTWKGARRWLDEHSLGCCSETSSNKVREEGLTFDMFKCLASCNGADVIAHRAPTPRADSRALEDFTSLFRNMVKTTCRSVDRQFIVISYSRESLGQSGAGHFSPIGGYHEASDSVLIMDVARFKYPPHWVPLRDIVVAMTQIDPVSELPRGVLEMRANPQEADPRHGLTPLHVPYMSRAAGQRLSNALMSALSICDKSVGGESWAFDAMRSWLQAASVAEPQLLRSLVNVGNAIALKEVIHRLRDVSLYQQLVAAYEVCRLVEDYPPLLLTQDTGSSESDELSLDSCGELWVLLLLMLPQHLRAAVAEELAAPCVPHDIAKAVRCPWALPLEALREALEHNLQPSRRDSECILTRKSSQNNGS
jgi:glutathione gamma-glutamylcysteinyltransferase